MNYKYDVSIVIVCMDNLTNLRPCLNSIKKYTNVSYEVFVVAYLFKSENLIKVMNEYEWVNFVESNEIRGFSENNNLALRLAKGKYCFVLNDDTYFLNDVIGKLICSFSELPKNTAIVSPIIYNVDGTVQVAGRPPIGLREYILSLFHLWSERNNGDLYTNQIGLFKTYNIIGAAFLIKTEVFRNVGFFDEYYFFCPEDIALSTQLNKAGYSCFVNSDAKLVHLGGGNNVTKTAIATMPAGEKGSIFFFADGSIIKHFFLLSLTIPILFLKSIYFHLKSKQVFDEPYIRSKGYINSIYGLLSKKTPKQLFVKYYNEIKKIKK